MIIGTLNDISILKHLSDDIYTALKWAAENRRSQFEKNEIIEIVPGKITAKYEFAAMGPEEKANLETHRKFIDIHIPLSSEETIGWRPASDLNNCLVPYDEQKDIAFFGEASQALIPLVPGQFVICFPQDAHAPNIGAGMHRKFCIKIIVEE